MQRLSERRALSIWKPGERHQRFRSLLTRAEMLASETELERPPLLDEDGFGPTHQERLLELLDELCSFLEHQLLHGDTYAIEPDLEGLEDTPALSASLCELVAVCRNQLHLLKVQSENEGAIQLSTTQVPFEGQLLGLSTVPVGMLSSVELSVLARSESALLEYRIATLPGEGAIPIPARGRLELDGTVLLARNAEVGSAQVVIVRSDPRVDVVRPVLTAERAPATFHLYHRSGPQCRWHSLFSTHHPIRTMLYRADRVFLVTRGTQILLLTLSPDARNAQLARKVMLETPSPIQSLILYDAGPIPLLVAGTADGTLFAIEPESFKIAWKFDTGHALSCLARVRLKEELLLVVGTPDGMLTVYHGVDRGQLQTLIGRLLLLTGTSPRSLLERTLKGWLTSSTLAETLRRVPSPLLLPSITPASGTGQESRDGAGWRARADHPYLRLLLIHLLMQKAGELEASGNLPLLRQALLVAFQAAERGSSLWQSEVIRFITWQTRLLLDEGDRRDISSLEPLSPAVVQALQLPPSLQGQAEGASGSDMRLALIFEVLEHLAIPAYGDARRRMERLIRRLRDEWLGPETYDMLRKRHAPRLSLRQLSTHNLKREASAALQRFETEFDAIQRSEALLHAMLAHWRRAHSPLSRLLSVQGPLHGICLNGGLILQEEEPGWVVGLHDEGLRIYELNASTQVPIELERFPLSHGQRMAASAYQPGLGELLAVAREGRISFLHFVVTASRPHLYHLPIAELSCSEPVTLLKLIRLPERGRSQQYHTVLATGYADGSFRLSVLESAEGEGIEGSSASRLHWTSILQLFGTAPIHHLTFVELEQHSILLVGIDQTLHLYRDVSLRNGVLESVHETFDLSSSLTALTVASPQPRHGLPTSVMVIGLANGMVEAFRLPMQQGDALELCWLYRAPQVITDLAYVRDATGGWFVAAADDGVLHLLRYGEAHHRVAVERYPFDLNPCSLPWLKQPLLLVSSPNRAVTLLESCGTDPMEQLDQLSPKLWSVLSQESLAERIIHLQDVPRALVAMSVWLLRDWPMDRLLVWSNGLGELVFRDIPVARTWLEVLLRQARQDPEARKAVVRYVRELLARPSVGPDLLVAILHVLGERLDRLEELELTLVQEEWPLQEPGVARAWIKLLETLWDRLASHSAHALLWWRCLNRLRLNEDGFTRRQLLPVVGIFARKLLKLTRENVLTQLGYLRDLEDSGLYVTLGVCEALAVPKVVGDALVRACVIQYVSLLRVRTVAEVYPALLARRALLLQIEEHLPGAREARGVYDDVLQAFDYSDYDQYSHFLIDAPEFLAEARRDMHGNMPLFDAFSQVRVKLLSEAPAAPVDSNGLTRFQDRVLTLQAHARVLEEFIQRWNGPGSLERLTVAGILARWRERILLPEMQRLKETIELAIGELQVRVPSDGGLADLNVRVHNLGGHSLDGLSITLKPGTRENWLWDGSTEYCPGPIHYGQSVDFHAQILVEEQVDQLTLTFELMFLDKGVETRRLLSRDVRVEREESVRRSRSERLLREEMPYTFDAIRAALVGMEPHRLHLLVSEEPRDREQLLDELVESLGTGSDASRRTLLSLDAAVVLEGPPRQTGNSVPFWWMVDRILKGLKDLNLLAEMPDRSVIRAEPGQTLERQLLRMFEPSHELWLVLNRVHRVFSSLRVQQVDAMRQLLAELLACSGVRVHVVLGCDFPQLVRLALPPSSLYRRVDVLDIDQPYPFDSPRARQELLRRAEAFLSAGKVQLSDLVRNKLIAQVGWNLGLFKRLLGPKLDYLRAQEWIQWPRGGHDSQGEPEELDPFLQSLVVQISAHLRARFAALPVLHRLALCAIASSAITAARKELKEGVVLHRELTTLVKNKGNRAKRLYPANAVLLERDVQYLQVTVGEVQGGLEVALYRGLDWSMALSHVLNALGIRVLEQDLEQVGLLREQAFASGHFLTVRVPLLRRWLISAHPFLPREEAHIRRRVLEDAPVATLIPLSSYPELHARLQAHSVLHEFLLFLGLMEEETRKNSAAWEVGIRRYERLLSVAKRYASWNSRPSNEAFRTLMTEWGELFGCQVEAVDRSPEDGVWCVTLDLSRLRIPRLGRAAIFGLTRPLDSVMAEKLREFFRRLSGEQVFLDDEMMTGSVGLVLYPVATPGRTSSGLEGLGHGLTGIFQASAATMLGGARGLIQSVLPSAGRPQEVSNALAPTRTQAGANIPRELGIERWRELLGDRLVPLLERDLIISALSEDSRREFLELISRGGFRLTHISPYQPIGPLKGKAADVLFVGREDEIDHILRHPDQQVAIVGSRKIGKTSLLLKLKQELSAYLGERAHVIYVECSEFSPAQVWRAITDKLGLEPVQPEEARLALSRQLQNLKGPVVFLLDEVDGVYGSHAQNREEAAEKLMWDLRSLAAAGTVRLIMAGYVRLYERRRDPRSAFHNFTTFRRLSALNAEAARALIRRPLSTLNLEFSSDGLIEQILEKTWRVPWILQLFCHQLIQRLDERMHASRRFDRRISREDVEGVSVQIEEELYSHLTNPKVMSSADQVLLLSMVEIGCSRFTEEELRSQLEARFGPGVWSVLRYDALPVSLDNLTLTLALTVENGVYTFPLELYPTVIRSRLGDVRPRLERLYEHLQRERF